MNWLVIIPIVISFLMLLISSLTLIRARTKDKKAEFKESFETNQQINQNLIGLNTKLDFLNSTISGMQVSLTDMQTRLSRVEGKVEMLEGR